MKYIITESKLKNIIFKFLDNRYDLENFYWNEDEFFDWDTGHNIEMIYFGEEEDFEDNYVIEYFKYPTHDGKWNDEELQYLPSFRFIDDEVTKLLSNMFGNEYEPIVIEWFNDRTGLNAKNIF